MTTLDQIEKQRWSYLELGYSYIKNLIPNGIEFDIEDVEHCPYCIGDDYTGIIDGIIKKIEINNNEILITYVNNQDTSREYQEDIRFLISCDLIDLIVNIQNKLENETKLASESKQ